MSTYGAERMSYPCSTTDRKSTNLKEDIRRIIDTTLVLNIDEITSQMHDKIVHDLQQISKPAKLEAEKFKECIVMLNGAKDTMKNKLVELKETIEEKHNNQNKLAADKLESSVRAEVDLTKKIIQMKLRSNSVSGEADDLESEITSELAKLVPLRKSGSAVNLSSNFLYPNKLLTGHIMKVSKKKLNKHVESILEMLCKEAGSK